MDNDARFVMKLVVWGLVLGTAAIVGMVVRQKKRSQNRNVLSALSQAIQNGKLAEALEVARLFLLVPCRIKGTRKGKTRLLEETLSAQLQAAQHLRHIYASGHIDNADSLIQPICELVVRQQGIASDDKIFSFVHGGPKREVVDSFSAAQAEKERLVRSLPVLSQPLQASAF